jgi:glutaminase
VASYIPQLARVDPELFAMALCTVDGQRYVTGDARQWFCVQSCGKPVSYAVALEEFGEEVVHRYIGREPSGHGFNEITLDKHNRPHNPLINAGAIVSNALLLRGHDVGERFAWLTDKWTAMAGGRRPRFDNAVYQSERQNADRNFALAYFLREQRAFPEGADLVDTLEFYFQTCSIEVDAEMMASIAATLAAGGMCPTTGRRVLGPMTVRNCLSMMYSCGMYDFSGEFAFTIGLPAKSGVSGALMVVVPRVMGLCVWSPRIDRLGNSVRGVELCRRLVEVFDFHQFDDLAGLSNKRDPTLDRISARARGIDESIWAASKGDIGAIQRLAAQGRELGGVDYDRRTPLHLAAAEGREEVVGFLLEHGVDASPRDRWGRTPLDEATVSGHAEVVEILEARGATRGGPSIPVVPSEAPAPAGAPAQDAGVIELIWAASLGDLQAVRRRVARGVDLDGVDYDRRTALHLAASEGHLAVSAFLLDHGAAPEPRDRLGGTPLHDAIRHGHEPVALLLRERESRAPSQPRG